MRRVIAVDPGAKTGVAILKQWEPDRLSIDVMDLRKPSIHAILSILNGRHNLIAIEHHPLHGAMSFAASESIYSSYWRWVVAAELRDDPAYRMGFSHNPRNHRDYVRSKEVGYDTVIDVVPPSWQSYFNAPRSARGKKIPVKKRKEFFVKIAEKYVGRSVSSDCADAVCILIYTIETNEEVKNVLQPK